MFSPCCRRSAGPGLRSLLLLSLSLLIPACGGGGGGGIPPSDVWTWISGSTVPDTAGVYGTQGVPNSANVPGARQLPSGWTAPDGSFWIFGGVHSSGAPGGLYNDLWRWNGSKWTWISGSNTPDHNGVYGTKGVANAANQPGSRTTPSTWLDAAGRFWLFGGEGYAASGGYQLLNDLWRWDGTTWTWMAGTNLIGQAGVYGTQGVAAAANTPGGRFKPASWATGGGSVFWLYGGSGFGASASGNGDLSDLWRWDGSTWTWIWGTSTLGDLPVYGVKGVPASTNSPGGRQNPVSWTDSAGNLWLFGGLRTVPPGISVTMNDLWRWDGTNWTWMAGATATDPAGVYGTRGVPDVANVPGGRINSIGWTTPGSGDFWLFGGSGYNSAGGFALLDDLWRWDGTTWTWISGGTIGNQWAVFGTQGMSDPTNHPGSHSSGAAFTGSDGSLWFWGGYGYGVGSNGDMNDLWRYQP
jgi:N-acetylneuraminic acid mutarotase